MNDFPLNLSPHVKVGRYADLSNPASGGDGIFLAGYEECDEDYIIERNDFPFWILEIVAGGHGSFREDKHIRHLSHGSAFTYGPGVPQSFRNEASRPFRKYFLVQASKEFPTKWYQAGLRPGRALKLRDLALIVLIIDRIIDEGQCSDVHTRRVVRGLEEVLLALIERHLGTTRGEKSRSRVVYDLTMDLLQRDYKEIRSLSDLADRSGYSGEYLCRVFKKYHGSSPYQVLLHRKMSAAWLLLRNSQLQVGAVASELGYEDPLHFSRVFRKVMGCTPSSVSS